MQNYLRLPLSTNLKGGEPIRKLTRTPFVCGLCTVALPVVASESLTTFHYNHTRHDDGQLGYFC